MEHEAEYNISSSIQDGILEIILTGELIASAVEELLIQIAYIIQAGGEKNLLVDTRAIKGITKAYTAARSPLPNIVKMNVAIVDLPENAAQEVFIQTRAQNAGHSLNFFANVDAAREWLKSKSEEDERIVMEEKRKAERMEEENEITITVAAGEENLPEGEINDNYTKNISTLGAKIQSHVFFPIGTVIELDFISKTLNQKITVLGEVKWIRVVIEDESYEAGVKFLGTPSESIKKLGDYISCKLKSEN